MPTDPLALGGGGGEGGEGGGGGGDDGTNGVGEIGEDHGKRDERRVSKLMCYLLEQIYI